jgi:hypothetical protein
VSEMRLQAAQALEFRELCALHVTTSNRMFPGNANCEGIHVGCNLEGKCAMTGQHLNG